MSFGAPAGERKPFDPGALRARIEGAILLIPRELSRDDGDRLTIAVFAAMAGALRAALTPEALKAADAIDRSARQLRRPG